MPYYIYRITPGSTEMVKNLERLETHESFKEAKTRARGMRAELGTDTEVTIKIVFAASELEAEERLLEHREAPILAEWEK